MKCKSCNNYEFKVDEGYPDKLIFTCNNCYQEIVLRYEKK